MKKIIALLLAICTLACTLCLASCGDDSKNTVTVTADPDGINVCLASEPDTIDPALNSAVDGATLCAHLFSGLAKWAQDENGSLVIVADACEELVDPVVNQDGTVTYTYTLREGLKWSDGVDVKPSDFAFAWNRAASVALAADYNYMFQVVKGYNEMQEDTTLSLDVVADDDARTLTVTLYNAVSYWNELLAFPTYYPVRSDVVSNEAWATDASTYVCNGPYTIKGWKHDSLIVLTKNENYIDADQITMPAINFYLSDDANNMLANFENGSWQLIDDVPTAEMARLATEYADEYVVAGQIGTYYVCWNVNEEILPADQQTGTAEEQEAKRQEIRAAIGLLFDRNYIVEEIGQAGQVPASSFVAMGMTEADGVTEFYTQANIAEGNSYIGYYDVSEEAMESNITAALAVLDKYYEKDESGKYTNFPTLTYLYNTSEGHKAIGEYLQAALATYGITMTLENQEWNTFLNTRKEGDYSIARNGWLADYNDPICFLDMWTTTSGNNDVQYGKDAHGELQMFSLDTTTVGGSINVTNGTWAETYDALIAEIKGTTDNETRMKLMHMAEDMLMDTGAIVPLYYYTDIYMVDDSVKGFFSNPLGYKYFMYCTIED